MGKNEDGSYWLIVDEDGRTWSAAVEDFVDQSQQTTAYSDAEKERTHRPGQGQWRRFSVD